MWRNTAWYRGNEDYARTTELKVNDLEITVTKYIGYGDELVMHCPMLGISARSLGTSSMAEGQLRAIAIVKNAAEKILHSLEKHRTENL
jgi:hypothetical protein